MESYRIAGMVPLRSLHLEHKRPIVFELKSPVYGPSESLALFKRISKTNFAMEPFSVPIWLTVLGWLCNSATPSPGSEIVRAPATCFLTPIQHRGPLLALFRTGLKYIDTNIGTPEQWAVLEELHPGLLGVRDVLIDLATLVAETEVPLDNLADTILYSAVRVCIDEWYELLLLAANGYDRGIQRPLRSLYERVVTSVYITNQPELAERFVNYHAVQCHRAIVHARRVLSDDAINQAIAPLSIHEIEAQYEAEKSKYRHSWDVDLATMSNRVGEELSGLYLACYVAPTFEAHATLHSMCSRVSDTEQGFGFNYQPNLKSIVGTVLSSMTLVRIVLKAAIARFSLPFGDQIERLGKIMT